MKKPPYATAICAHRGASVLAPENTLAAFRRAVEARVDLIELDVIATRDQELVVFHDLKLGRTTDRPKGKVAALTWEELRACDAGGWFGAEWKGERVPHLREALETIEHRAVPMIEVKQSARKVPALVPKLCRFIEQGGYADHVILIAWDDFTALALRAGLPQALIARIAFTRYAIGRARKHGFDGVVPWRPATTARFLRDAHQAGVWVAPWTVNRPKDMAFFCRNACDIVITDVPHVLKDHLEARMAPEPPKPAGGQPPAPAAQTEAKSA